MMSHQKKGIHPRPCGIINLSNIISYGRGTLPYLIDKVYDDYLKDYGRVGYIGMNSIEKACKSEFEKNGIEYDHYDVKEALESKSHYNIVNAYVKGYSDTREGMTSSSIRDFMIQYKQGLDAGDIEYKDAEFERVAEIFKRYDKYETFNKESKDAIDGLRI